MRMKRTVNSPHPKVAIKSHKFSRYKGPEAHWILNPFPSFSILRGHRQQRAEANGTHSKHFLKVIGNPFSNLLEQQAAYQQHPPKLKAPELVPLIPLRTFFCPAKLSSSPTYSVQIKPSSFWALILWVPSSIPLCLSGFHLPLWPSNPTPSPKSSLRLN